MKHERLFVKVDNPILDRLLADWNWLVEKEVSLVSVTAMGDLILKDQEGGIWFLDTIEGDFRQIATNDSGYQDLLKTSEFRQRYLQYYGVLNLIDAGSELGVNQCYSPDVPPHLGGELDENNLKPTDIYVHFSVSGQIWRQTKHLEPGTKIHEVQVSSPDELGVLARLRKLLRW